MPLITDPDLLADGTDVVVNTTNRTIRILTTGNVDNEGATGGVTGQALYSWLKEEWKTNADYIKFPFPMEAITPEQFEFINDWVPFDDATRKLIRTAGWAERTAAGAVTRQYMGVVSLGSLGATDQPYYRFGTNTATNFTYQGPVNEAIQIFGDASNGNFNFTDGDNLDIYCREQGKTYASSNNTAIGAPTLTYITYRFPLSNGTDLNISANDTTISTTAPWNQITIEYFTTDQLFDVDGVDGTEPYRIIITDASGNATTQQIYEKIQWSLRQDADIDTGAGIVNGKVATSLLSFVGPTLVGANGVFISGLNANFLNSVDFYDFNGVLRRYPFVSAGTINFGSFAGSGDFIYRMFFTTTPNNNDYGTATALLVNDKDGNPISGTYSGSPIPWTFNYDSNTQGGRTISPPGNVNVKVVGLGLSGGQFTVVDHVITRTAGQSILVSPAQERNYANPV
jgi:hypothetical protein